jgi:hypothetical protein
VCEYSYDSFTKGQFLSHWELAETSVLQWGTQLSSLQKQKPDSQYEGPDCISVS